jgi:hypothetical protein
VNDVEGRSRMVLTAFAIVMLCDRHACENHKLLKDHDLGVDETILAYLLLSRVHEKKFLLSLELYVASRRSGQKPGHTSVAHPIPHDASVPVRVFQSHDEMKSLIDVIQTKCASNETQHKVEVAEQMKQYQQCVKDAEKDKALRHNFATFTQDFYERMLPKDQFNQMHVIFELRIPDEIALLREVLNSVMQMCVKNLNAETATKSAWLNDSRLMEFRKQPFGTLKCQLSYTEKNLCPPKAHVKDHKTFIVDNAREVHLADHWINKAYNLSVEKWEWFIADFLKVGIAVPRYKALEFAVCAWMHDENQVLARKSLCHKDLSLREFEVFGTLRAGIRLQLPRLLRAIAQQSLSFDHEGVLDLLSYTLNQAGPSSTASSSDEGAWRRQAHELLANQKFCDDLCTQVAALLEQQSSNWTRHLVLLSIVRIGRCMLNHAPDVSKSSELLLRCRAIAVKWIEEVRTVMSRSSHEDRKSLRLKLADIAAMATLTYDVCCPKLLETGEHATTFILLRAVLADNLLVGKIQLSLLERYRVSLILEGLRISLEVEPQLYAIAADASGSAALTDFVKLHWGDASQGECGTWKQSKSPADRWYQASFASSGTTSVLQIDVLRGQFLVNGAPVGRLPAVITGHKDYIHVFGGAVFDVQPTTGGGWRSLTGADNYSFSFYRPSKTGGPPLIIEERPSADGSIERSQLVSPQSFEGDLPETFILQCSHWLVSTGGSPRLFFRQKSYDAPNFKHGNSVQGAPFVLDVKERTIVDQVLQRQLVDRQSATFAALYDSVFARLALRHQVEVYQSSQGNFVVLPHLQGIRFLVDGSRLQSMEFGGDVAADQNLGTLIGLRHGLVLQES